MCLRHERIERGEPLGGGGVEQVASVEVEDVEEVGHHGDARLLGGAAGGVLEGGGTTLLGQRQGLAVEHEPVGRQRTHHLDHLGQPGGDVVEAAGDDDDLVAVAVHLDPDAVELGVDRHLAAELGHRGSHVRSAGGQHRLDRSTHLQADRRKRLGPRERGPGGGDRAAGEHRGAAYVGEGQLDDLRHRLLGDGVERALAEVAGDDRPEPFLLLAGRPAEEVGRGGGPCGLGAGTGQRRHLLEGLVHLGDGQ